MPESNRAPSSPRPLSAIRSFLDGGTAGGLVLMAAATAALAIANSALAPDYFAVLKRELGGLSVLHWINDALMAAFFLLVGLEIKRELLDGQLATWPRRALPGIAAAGGMIAPALVYLALNFGSAATLRGWAVPTATDIAFALGVLSLSGPRAPVSLKIFLTALAIIDDLGAVAIIAAFYTSDLSLAWFAAAASIIAALAALNWYGVQRLGPYLALGVLLWICVHESGVHATLAGVFLALTIPLRPSPGRPDQPDSPLHILEHGLNKWVAFGIVPMFGFANAGVPLSGLTFDAVLAPVPIGIAAGLFFGKQIGVFLATWATVRLKLAEPPADASWAQVYGVSLLCGVGFTMSLFIGLLAFPDDLRLQDEVKIGVLAGSLLSAIVGTIVLRVADRRRKTGE